jgi:hypothetical protein
MKRQGLKGKRAKKMSAAHSACAQVEPQKRRATCDGTCGRCQACKDDFFFQQICDEVEGTYSYKTVQ